VDRPPRGAPSRPLPRTPPTSPSAPRTPSRSVSDLASGGPRARDDYDKAVASRSRRVHLRPTGRPTTTRRRRRTSSSSSRPGPATASSSPRRWP
jgi:hypothetical protein